jgi:hypothetical protein
MTFTVKFEKPTQLRGPGWKAAARVWADEVGPLVKRELQAKAPVAPVNGGALRKSIRYRSKVLASRAEMTFTAVDYARFVIEGTSAHEIPFKKPQPLLFDVGWRTVSVVHHPGTKPNDFVRRAITPLRPAIQAVLDEAMAAALKP